MLVSVDVHELTALVEGRADINAQHGEAMKFDHLAFSVSFRQSRIKWCRYIKLLQTMFFMRYRFSWNIVPTLNLEMGWMFKEKLFLKTLFTNFSDLENSPLPFCKTRQTGNISISFWKRSWHYCLQHGEMVDCDLKPFLFFKFFNRERYLSGWHTNSLRCVFLQQSWNCSNSHWIWSASWSARQRVDFSFPSFPHWFESKNWRKVSPRWWFLRKETGLLRQRCWSKQGLNWTFRQKYVAVLPNIFSDFFSQKDGLTAIFLACQEGFSDIAKVLLDAKASVNLCSTVWLILSTIDVGEHGFEYRHSSFCSASCQTVSSSNTCHRRTTVFLQRKARLAFSRKLWAGRASLFEVFLKNRKGQHRFSWPAKSNILKS